MQVRLGFIDNRGIDLSWVRVKGTKLGEGERDRGVKEG